MRQLGVISRTLLAAVAFSALGVGEASAQSTNPPDMIFVKGGTFKMGSNDGYADEAPVHSVTLSDFYIGKYEVTVAQYRQFCTATNHRFPDPPKPDWYEEHENAASIAKMVLTTEVLVAVKPEGKKPDPAAGMGGMGF